MFNYLIKIEYDGTSFVGWQSQKNGKSVQDTIEKALKKVLKLRLKIIGAGRTDKGVHALSQYANFKYSKKIKNKASKTKKTTKASTRLQQTKKQPPACRGRRLVFESILML